MADQPYEDGDQGVEIFRTNETPEGSKAEASDRVPDPMALIVDAT